MAVCRKRVRTFVLNNITVCNEESGVAGRKDLFLYSCSQKSNSSGYGTYASAYVGVCRCSVHVPVHIRTFYSLSDEATRVKDVRG